MKKLNIKQLISWRLKGIKSLYMFPLIIFGAWIVMLVYFKFFSNELSWESNLLLSLMVSLITGILIIMLSWIFNHCALETMNSERVHRGAIAIIDQTAQFLCTLPMWTNGQSKQETQNKMQKCLEKAGKPDRLIELCRQQIWDLKNIKITSENTKGFMDCVREHLDFLERTLNVYGECFAHYKCCEYLLSQHSELHKALLAFESTMIPTRGKNKKEQSKTTVRTKASVIEEVFEDYLTSLEEFLDKCQTIIE